MHSESDIFDLSCEFASEGRDGNATWRQRGRECREFVIGRQWDADDVAKLEAQGVLAITVNHCLPIRDHLVGRQQQNPRDITVLPERGGNSIVAMIFTAMLRHVVGHSHGLPLKTEMFKDGITVGRGFLGLDVDYSTDPVNGDIVLRTFSPFHVDPDPLGLEYNLNLSGRYINTYLWIDREELKARYPDAAKDIGDLAPGAGESGVTVKTIKRFKAWLLGSRTASDIDMEDAEYIDGEIYDQLRRRRIPVRTSWIKTFEKVAYWVDSQQQQIMRLMESSKISKARQSVQYLPERFRVFETVLPVLHKVVAAGDVQLDYQKDPFKFLEGFGWSFSQAGNPLIFDSPALFPVVPYYPYFEDGETFGKLDNLLGPQREENKRRTQFLRLINSVASAGWTWKEGSLSEEMKEMLKNYGTRPNLSIEYKTDKPEKIQPLNPSTAHLTAAMTSAQDMKEISGVNDENLAYKTPSGMSGYAIDLKQREGMIANEIVFGHLGYSGEIFAEVLLQVLRSGGYYSYEEIKSLIDEEELISGPVLREATKRIGPPPVAPPPPNPDALAFAEQRFGEKGAMLKVAASLEFQRAVAEYQQGAKQYEQNLRQMGEQVVMEAVGDIKVGRYGLKAIESQSSPTMRSQRFGQLAELDKMRPGQLPFDELVEASDVQNKERIIEKMKTAGPVLPGA